MNKKIKTPATEEMNSAFYSPRINSPLRFNMYSHYRTNVQLMSEIASKPPYNNLKKNAK